MPVSAFLIENERIEEREWMQGLPKHQTQTWRAK
jgi:hypothetical protein